MGRLSETWELGDFLFLFFLGGGVMTKHLPESNKALNSLKATFP